VEAGWAAAGCLRAGKRRPVAWEVCGLKEGGEREMGPLERRERGERKVFLFLLNSFQIRFSNIQTSIKQKSMHSNHDAQTLIISKLF
jgi:hypothetical protein